MKVGVFTYFSFPKGLAPTTRIIAYCKGLQQNGCKVEVFSCRWYPDNEIIPLEGEVEGVPYKNSHLWHTKYGKLFKVTVDKYLLHKNTIRNIKQSHGKEPFDVILVACDVVEILSYYIPKINKLGIKTIFIIDEYPPAIQALKNEVPQSWINSFKAVDKYFSGRVLMTDALRDYYNDKIRVLPSHIMCSILDETRFANICPNKEERKYLCYMGNLMLKKDDICTIIRAFCEIMDDFPDLDLHLYGNESTHEENDLLHSLIAENEANNRVFLKGRADYEEVPSILAGATLLVTAQPNTKRAEGGFPTKLGEYMMSGVPMIVTNVGEIHKYVTNQKDCYMVTPESPHEYAETLRNALIHYDDSIQIAKHAYENAYKNYSSKIVGRELMSFLQQIVNL